MGLWCNQEGICLRLHHFPRAAAAASSPEQPLPSCSSLPPPPPGPPQRRTEVSSFPSASVSPAAASKEQVWGGGCQGGCAVLGGLRICCPRAKLWDCSYRLGCVSKWNNLPAAVLAREAPILAGWCRAEGLTGVTLTLPCWPAAPSALRADEGSPFAPPIFPLLRAHPEGAKLETVQRGWMGHKRGPAHFLILLRACQICPVRPCRCPGSQKGQAGVYSGGPDLALL